MYFEDLKPGLTVRTAPAVIDRERMLSFAREYDNVPLHTDEEYAKATVFGGLIAPGVMTYLTVWAKYLEVDFFGRELLAGRSVRIEWLRPVYPGDELTGRAEITKLTRRNEKNGLSEMTLDVYNQDGVLVLSALTEAVVKCRPREKGSNGSI